MMFMKNRSLRTIRFASLALAVLLVAPVLSSCAGAPIETGVVTSQPVSTTSPATTPQTSQTPTTTATTTGTSTAATTSRPSGTTTQPTKPARPAETILKLQLEGMDEEVTASLFTSKLGYTMYYEKNRIKVILTDSQVDSAVKADTYLPNPPTEGLPEIYLEIGHLDRMTREDALAKIRGLFSQKYPKLEQQENIKVGMDQVDALVLHGISGSKWDSDVITATVFSDGKGGVYYTLSVYFLEAAEGWASHFSQYLKTFRIE